MNRKKKSLKYKKERSILSDVLPYELPLTFTNRHFYEFIISNKIKFHNDRIEWISDSKALDYIVSILFGLDHNNISNDEEDKKYCVLKLKQSSSIPFSYKIRHKDNEYRELTIPHQKNQLQITDLYDRYKELIIYYCSLSSFSIRKPARVSKYIFYKDEMHYDNLSNDKEGLEENNSEYQNIRSFFVYKEYSNIYKFYESYHYLRCEKKYNKMIKLDISKCFDSIYTHSLSWAIFGKDSVKENLSKLEKTFPGNFDKLMQSINYNETNGIIIGPEISRIFAEIILQRIDFDLENKLGKCERNYKHRVDYEIFRYVDDYFVFYNNESTKEEIIMYLQVLLKNFKLYLNTSKSITYSKPIITNLSIAKQKISSLLYDNLVYYINKESLDQKKSGLYINSRRLITKFKTILKECDVGYNDVLSYTLTLIELKCDEIVEQYYKDTSNSRSIDTIKRAIVGILEFVFFIYSVSPRVNASIKLCRIIRIFIKFLSQFSESEKEDIYKCIYDEIRFVLDKNSHDSFTQVETLYLLTSLSELGRNYSIEERTLAKYFKIKENDGIYCCKTDLNYFSITVLLFYIQSKNKYQKIRNLVETTIVNIIKSNIQTIKKNAENSMLLLDSISCPHISFDTKQELLNVMKIPNEYHTEIINFKDRINPTLPQLWFSTWIGFNFSHELDAKQSQEVY